MEGARQFLLSLAIVTLVGCHGSADVPYPTYASAPSPYVPSAGSGNAFDAYVLAAGEARDAVAGMKIDPLHRSFFTPDQRLDLEKRLGPALRRIASAKGSCDFHYVPTAPGGPSPFRAEWRLLGRALRWKIDDLLVGADPAAALPTANVAMRFAGDLCGGGANDRTLGVEIANDVTEALVPALSKLDPAGLHRLANAVKNGLLRRPPLAKTLGHGDEDMALAIQTLQDCLQKEQYGPIETAMGSEFRDLGTSIKELRAKPRERAKFFEDLDQDRKRLSLAWRTAAALPTSRRAEVLKVKLQGERPRKAFARHFFLIGRPLLEIEDRSVARLRLLILEAELRRTVISSKRAPASLAKVAAPWAIDPYNGRTFGYLPDGAEFRVYSVGSNLKDDLGDTDAAGLNPDIRTVAPN